MPRFDKCTIFFMEIAFAGVSVCRLVSLQSPSPRRYRRWSCSAEPPTEFDIPLQSEDISNRSRAWRVRQSLPTTRERRWLAEQRIGRDRSRSPRFSRQESFSLAVWHLGIVQNQAKRPTANESEALNEHVTSSHNVGLQGSSQRSFIVASNKNMAESTPQGTDMIIEKNDSQQIDPTSIAMYGGNAIDPAESFARGSDSAHLATENQQESISGEGLESLPPSSRPQQPFKLTKEQFYGVMSWAYVVGVRATKFLIGKRAVVRNRAQRRVRAALRTVFPEHAARGREYLITVSPAALVTPFNDLVQEAEASLRETHCWHELLGTDQTTRPRYRKR